MRIRKLEGDGPIRLATTTENSWIVEPARARQWILTFIDWLLACYSVRVRDHATLLGLFGNVFRNKKSLVGEDEKRKREIEKWEDRFVQTQDLEAGARCQTRATAWLWTQLRWKLRVITNIQDLGILKSKIEIWKKLKAGWSQDHPCP